MLRVSKYLTLCDPCHAVAKGLVLEVLEGFWEVLYDPMRDGFLAFHEDFDGAEDAIGWAERGTMPPIDSGLFGVHSERPADPSVLVETIWGAPNTVSWYERVRADAALSYWLDGRVDRPARRFVATGAVFPTRHGDGAARIFVMRSPQVVGVCAVFSDDLNELDARLPGCPIGA